MIFYNRKIFRFNIRKINKYFNYFFNKNSQNNFKLKIQTGLKSFFLFDKNGKKN